MHRHLHHREATQDVSSKKFPSRSQRISVLLGVVLVLSACTVRESTAESGTTSANSTTPTQSATTAQTTEATTQSTGTTTQSASGTIRHVTGFSLAYPKGWHETGIVISTEFATEADCVSALIVDQAPPTDPAQAGFVLQSGVQVCAQPVDGDSLDTYMESVYGTAISEFTRGECGEVVEYRSGDGLESHTFAQTDSYRYQVTTFVTADPDLEEERLAQVQQILASLTFS
jgi:hypothetical protein